MQDYLSIFDDHLDKTCFILKGEKIIYSSSEHGVKPILDYYSEFADKKTDLTVIDKIMGRGAIILAKLINATSVITPIISEDALNLAIYYQMDVTYKRKVNYIINRTHDGRCPIESSVLDITNPQEGYEIILQTLKELSSTTT